MIDQDDDATTGCVFITPSSLFKGVEKIVTTHVITDGSTATVTGVGLQTCVDPIANAFSSEVQIDAGGWPVGLQNGGMVVETRIPYTFLGNLQHARLAFVATGGTSLFNSILTQRDGQPLIFPPVLPPHQRAASKGPRPDITLDGTLGPWQGMNPIATGDSSPPSLRILNVWAYMSETNLFFAFAAQANKNAPTAYDDDYFVVTGGTLDVAAPGVLTNDTDPNNKPLTAILISGPSHGALTLNADGSFNYTNDGSPSNLDHFQYKANNGSADSNTAQVTIDITENNPPPNNQAPQFTSPATTTFLAGHSNLFFVTTTGHPTPTVTESGALPSGVIFVQAPGGGVLQGTPAVGTGGVYHITFTATNVQGTATQHFTLTVNEPPAILSANATTFTAGTAGTFTITTRGYPFPAIGETGALPAGVTLTDNGNGTATLSGIPAATSGGVYPLTLSATNILGNASQSFTLTVNQSPIFTSANAATFTAGSAGTFHVATSAYPAATVSLTSGTLPSGVTFTAGANGTATIAGTPAVGTGGVYTVTLQAANGIGSNATQTFTLTVDEAPSFTSAASTTFTTSTPGTFTVTVLGYPIPTITHTGALPSGVTFVDNGNRTATISGTPGATTGGTYPLTLTATNSVTTANQSFTLTVNQPPVITSANSLRVQAGTPVSFTVTTTGFPPPAINESGALPTGLTYTDNGNGTGTISGTPANGSGGVYPITFTATNAAGTNNQNFTITACNNIVVTNPATSTATANAAFSQTFTQTGAVGSATFTTASTLPAGLTLATNGTLSGTPTVVGTFPIVVTVTDANGCSGTGSTYNLVISCQTISVTNPATNSGTATVPFSQTFTASNTIGTVTFTTASTLPAGITLATNGTLSGTPTVVGTFPIVVTATDANGCSGSGATYNLTIACQTIPVTNPSTTTGTAGAAFSQTFTASNTIGAVTFTTASSLPTGLSLATNGTLSGTPTVVGTFPIVVTATDGNGCQGTGATYNLVISCQTITVTDPANTTATAGSPFSEQFTQSGAIGGATFSTASGLPSGVTLSSAGLLSGTPTQIGTFPIVVTVTDGNGCTGSGATYNLVINCPVITVTNPSSNTDAAGTALVAANFTFTQSGAVGGAGFSTASALPPGVTLTSGGVLTGTPTGGALDYPITVTVTDGNGCTGTSSGYILHITCPTITVTNPGVNSGTAGVAFSQTFTQSGGQGTITWSESGALPTGITLNTATGVLSGTTHQVGSFPITVTATDQYGCQGTGSTYTLTINCQTITVTNPATNTGTVDAAFSQTFTVSGILDTVTWSETGALPAGITLDASTGVLSGTPTVPGTFPITVKATDTNGCFGTSNYTLTINCQTITVTNPVTNTGTVDAAFSQTFTQSGAHASATFTTASTLPPGLSLSAGGVLSGTPTAPGNFPITVTVTDANGCTGTGATYNLTINCQVITVTNPATNTGTVDAAFSQQFTQSGAHGTATFSTASALPAGLTLDSSTGILSGTPTVNGTFPIVVTVTDSNGCTGSGATYNLTINCQTITVTNPANNTGTVSAPFSEQFTQSGAHASATFSTASTLPTGLTLSSSGLLSGTPLQPGSFPIVVTVTDANGCTGSGATYNLTINCQVITVTNPSSNSDPAGTPLTAANFTFTQSGAVGGATFTSSSTMPTGVSLTTGGVLTGTPTQGGSFPITVVVTDGNGCTGSSSGYTLTITCPVITVTNPATNTGTAGVAFSQTFTQSGGQGTITWSETGALPTGITLNTATGVLSGTTSQVGSFPITVTATDQNGCQGSGSTYTLTINCQTITVTNPGVNTGTVDAAFSQTFTVSGILGTVTWSETGALPAGITLNSSTGVLSGTPTVNGTFPITVKATDTNGCFGTSAYTLTINCQTISVTNPATNTGTVDAAFSQTFTQSGGHGATTFSTASALPTGLTLSSGGVLSGTPTVKGTFPITVTATDSNGCTGTGATYTLTINCQTITVTNPATNTGTVNAAFSQSFSQSGAHATATFTTASTLPAGITLSTAGLLAGTPTQPGSFPIVVTVTDANGCTGTGATYNLTIACQTITVTNPATTTGTVATAFSQQFTSGGGVGTTTFSTASTLPTGLTLHAATGILDGTPTQSGTFPIVVKATDSNGCFGTGATYNLVIACNVITVTDPATNSGTAGQPFSATFTQSGGNGTITWTTSSTLPTGILLNSSTGVLSGTPTQVGAYPLVITATDGNGCTGNDASSNYTLTINCNVVTVTNATSNSVQASSSLTPASNWTFTASGNVGTVTWSETGALPSGITLSSAGVLSGSSTQIGSYPITVKATDSDGCFGTSPYTLTVTCPTITPARNGGGSFPAGTIGTAYTGQSFTATPSSTYTFAKTAGTLPTGLSLSSAGAISGTPTATGTFTFTVTATDSSTSCTGSASFQIAINPSAGTDSYSNLVNNTQAVVTGGSTSSPTTPFVTLTGSVLANDLPSGGVAAQAANNVATTNGGSVNIAADGTFIYTPPVTATALTSDSFTYTIQSDTGATGTPTTATGTVNLTLSGRVWYVKNNVTNGNGQSQSPFNSTSNFSSGARTSPDKSSDIIYIYTGDGTTTNQTSGIVLLANEQLIGNGVALVVNTNTLVVAGTKPLATNSTLNGDVVTLNDGNTVKGLTLTGATGTGSGINGTSHAGFTGDTLTIQNNAGNGLLLNTMTGTVGVTNSAITNNATGLAISAGTAAITLDNTNTITANSGQRSVSIGSRPVAAGNIGIGASITDNGTGININGNSSGTIAFTGTQTLSTTTNTGVNLVSNSGTTINFSGTLNITTTTGTAFNAGTNGTINVTGTANVTTGAAANGVFLGSVTVGASGVTFSSVNTTGATNGVNLSSLGNGNVTINGGTISGGTTGLLMTTLGTSTVTLSGMTFTGSTTAISGSTFGTLSISSVSVSGATALNLATGAVSGTFTNVSSTGGTANGVNLNAVTGTWGASAGSLTGASNTTFNVTGGSGGTITWAPTITQANGALAVSIAGSNSNTINFGGLVTSQTAGTGITITASSGTYNFNGGVTVSTGGVLISNGESGTITFASNSTITSIGAASSFQVDGSTTAVTAAITYSGTITRTGAVGYIVDVNKLNSPGSLAMNHAAPSFTQTFNGAPTTASGIRIINSSSTSISVANASISLKNIDAVTLTGNTGASITLNGLAITKAGSGGTGKGIVLSGAGTVNIGAGTSNPSVNMTSGAAIGIDGNATAFTGTLNLTNCTVTGTGANTAVTLGNGVNGGTLGGTGNTITAGAASALILSSYAITNGTTFTAITSTGGVNAISMTSCTGGTMTIGATSALSAQTGSSFLISGGSVSVSYAGTITQNTANQRAVDIQNTTGGTVSFTGNIGSTGAGIFMNSNTGATINYTGVLTLSTGANPAFTATAGGTVSSTATTSTITTTTGTAVNIANTTIGASGMTFQSVSAGTAASGPTNGIIVNNTGTGAFTISGTGTAGTGGTIQKTTGTGIALTSMSSFSASWMTIQNCTFDGIHGQSVAGFSLANSTVSTNGTRNSGATNFDGGVNLKDTTGAVTFNTDAMNGNFVNNVRIDTTTGTSTAVISSLTVTNGSYNGAVNGGSFLVQLFNTSQVTTGSITGATFANNQASGPVNIVTNDNSVAGNGAGAPSTGTITINSCTFTNNAGVGPAFSAGGGNSTSSSAMYVRFTNNNLQGTHSHAVSVETGATSTGGTQKILISGNTIGTSGTSGSGSAIGEGIVVTQQGKMTMTCTITGNTLRQIPLGRGIDFQALGPTAAGQSASSYPINVAITGNDVNPQDTTGFPLYAIYVSADDQGSPTLVHAEIHGNTVPSSPPACDTQCGGSQGMIEMEQAPTTGGPSSGTLYNFNGTGANVSAEIAATNTGTAGQTCSTNAGMTLTSTPVTTVP